MCIRDSSYGIQVAKLAGLPKPVIERARDILESLESGNTASVSYTHLRAHETVLDLVCRLLLEKKKHKCTV